jgi:dephospho-CoA kinase
MAIMLTILKYLGFIYYTVATTTIVIFLHLFFRMNRRPNQYFYKLNKPISKPILTFYTLLNLFLNYLYFQTYYLGYFVYVISELITFFFSYIVLSGFHVYGITGQICSGKTSACEYLKKRYKAAIISLDEINHRILNDRSVIERIKKEFGNEVIMNNNGREIVNRAELKRIIFGDKLKRKNLESITHPKIMMLFFKMLFTQRFLYLKKYVFIENAILLRFKLFKMLLKGTISICVENEKVLIERIMRRDNHGDMNTTEETARNILKNQMSLEEFKSKSDIVIYNDDNYQSLELNIDQIMRDIAMFSKNDRIFVN